MRGRYPAASSSETAGAQIAPDPAAVQAFLLQRMHRRAHPIAANDAYEHPAMSLLGSNPEVAAHGRAVARIATRIAAALGMETRERGLLAVAAGVHDLGKV